MPRAERGHPPAVAAPVLRCERRSPVATGRGLCLDRGGCGCVVQIERGVILVRIVGRRHRPVRAGSAGAAAKPGSTRRIVIARGSASIVGKSTIVIGRVMLEPHLAATARRLSREGQHAAHERLCGQQPMRDGAERKHAGIVVLFIVIGFSFIGRRMALATEFLAFCRGLDRLVAIQYARAEQQQHECRDGQHHADGHGNEAFWIRADRQRRHGQHKIAEDAAKPGRKRPGGRRRDTAGDGGGQHCAGEPGCKPPQRPVDRPRPGDECGPDDRRRDGDKRRQAEELHREIGEDRTGIAHGVGDWIIGGMAEARVGDVPGRKRGHLHRDQRQQRQTTEARRLTLDEGKDAAVRIAHHKGFRYSRTHALKSPARPAPSNRSG